LIRVPATSRWWRTGRSPCGSASITSPTSAIGRRPSTARGLTFCKARHAPSNFRRPSTSEPRSGTTPLTSAVHGSTYPAHTVRMDRGYCASDPHWGRDHWSCCSPPLKRRVRQIALMECIWRSVIGYMDGFRRTASMALQ